ncbi:MAG: hypothetical protein H7287_00840 [Thermoleophilia bacterium]|nr:hypothetical protein [Thermoleophilia bacterium]
MTPPATETIFQLSDLNRNGKKVMDAARDTGARLRDADGSSFVIVREGRLVDLERLADVAVNLATVERALRHAGTETALDITAFGDWTWLRQFDREDLGEFIEELNELLISGIRELRSEPILLALEAWVVTARALEDDTRRDVLLSAFDARDFTEADRPAQNDA